MFHQLGRNPSISQQIKSHPVISVISSLVQGQALYRLIVLCALYITLNILPLLALVPTFSRELIGTAPLKFDLKVQKTDGSPFGNADSNAGILVKNARDSRLEAVIGQRRFTIANNRDGEAHIPLILPDYPVSIQIYSRSDSGDHDLYLRNIQYPENADEAYATPSIMLAMVEQDNKVLWIVGRGAAFTGIELVDAATGEALGKAQSDENGIFQAVIKVDSKEVEKVVAHGTKDSSPIGIQKVPDLPIKRATHISFENGVPVVELEVRLPSDHPHIALLTQGYIRSDRFVYEIYGWNPQWDSRSIVQTLEISENQAIVKIKGTWFGPVERFDLFGEHYFSGEDLAGQPLILSNDTVAIDFTSVQPAWFGYPAPTRLSENTAEWQGPLAFAAVRPVLRVGVKLPSDIQAKTSDELQKQLEKQRQTENQEQSAEPPETMLDWVATDRFSSGESGLHLLWRMFIVLLPYLGFLWMARTSPFGRAELWPPACSAVSVLGISSLWYGLFAALIWLTEPWLHRILAYALTSVKRNSDGLLETTFLFGGTNAFVLLALALAILGPVYFRFFEACFTNEVSAPRESTLPVARKPWRMRLQMAWGILWGGIVAGFVRWIVGGEFRNSDDTAQWINSGLQQYFLLNAENAEKITHALTRDTDLLLVSLAALAIPLLLTIGARACLFGVGLFFIALRYVSGGHGVLMDIESAGQFFSDIGQIPWWPCILTVVLLAVWFVEDLLRGLLPKFQPGVQPIRLGKVSLALVIVSMVLPFIPAQVALLAGAVVFFSILSWLLLQSVRHIERARPWALRCENEPRWMGLFGALVGLALAWPVAAPNTPLKFNNFFSFFGLYGNLIVFLITGLFLLLLKDYSDRREAGTAALEKPLWTAAAVMFTFFVLQSPSTWAFIPVPTVVAWLAARFWLIRRDVDNIYDKNLLEEPIESRRERIAAALAAKKSHIRLAAIEKLMAKKLDTMEWPPEEYDKKLKGYRDYFANQAGKAVAADNAKLGEVLFRIAEASPWQAGMRFCLIGSLLAIVPLSLTLYDYLPGHTIVYPYPNWDLASVLLRSSASWLMIAFFFGFFYVHIRGNNGLLKGLALCVAMVAPIAIYRVLNVPSMEDLKSFLLWAMQIFAFCTLLGGISDYRVLRSNGYTFLDLLTIHNLPWISIFASSLAAAAAPAIIALLTGKLGDIAKTFVDLVLNTSVKSPP